VVLLVIEIIIWLLVIVACVLLTMAIRKIPVQYARRTTSGDFEQDMMGGNRQWIPLKLMLGYADYLCSSYHVYTCCCGWFI
jgi:preprotein translocase subunit SecY